jgi:hypothetical protein
MRNAERATRDKSDMSIDQPGPPRSKKIMNMELGERRFEFVNFAVASA